MTAKPDYEFSVLSLKIGRILVTEPTREHWNSDVARRLEVGKGSAHKVLRQFHEKGWVRDRTYENERKIIHVFYLLTKSGSDAISAALAPFQLTPLST